MNLTYAAMLARADQDREAAADAVERIRDEHPEFLHQLADILDFQPPDGDDATGIKIPMTHFAAIQMLGKLGLAEVMGVIVRRRAGQ